MTTPSRVLFVAWQDPQTRAIHPVARLVVRKAEDRYELSYIAGVHDAIDAGFVPFARMQNLDRCYFAEDLRAFPLTANRLMPASRPDFHEHLERLDLSGSAEPIQILARSEGRRATDNLEFFGMPDHDRARAVWIYHAFLRGVRYVDGAEGAIASLGVGDALEIVSDRDNDWDPRALALATRTGHRVGWLPGALLDDLHATIAASREVSVRVARVNLEPAPVQQRVLMRIEVPCHAGFAPHASDRFQPLAPEAKQLVMVDESDAH